MRLSLALSSHKNFHEKGYADFQLARSLEENYKTGRLVAWFKRITAIATNNELKGKAYHSLAALQEDICGDFSSAKNSFQLAINYLRKSTDREQLANTLFNYGYALFYRDRFDEAEGYLRKGLEVQLSLAEEDPEEYRSDLVRIYRILTGIALKKADDTGLFHWIEQWFSLTKQSANLTIDTILDEISSILKENGDIQKRYQVLSKIAHDYPSIQAKLNLAFCARDIRPSSR